MCTRRHLAYLDDQAGWSGEMILHLDDQAGCCSGVEVLRKHPPITWLEEAQISFAALLLQMQLLFKLTTQDTQTHSHKHKKTQTHTHTGWLYILTTSALTTGRQFWGRQSWVYQLYILTTLFSMVCFRLFAFRWLIWGSKQWCRSELRILSSQIYGLWNVLYFPL